MSKVARLAVLIALLFAAVPAYSTLAQDTTLINLSSSEALGAFLTGQDGLTLYTFDKDTANVSNCYDKCAVNWPPLLVDDAAKITVAKDIAGKFGTTTRKDNTLQVTYNGMPLYYWVNDAKAGDTTGHRVGRVWWVVRPFTAGILVVPELGNILVGPDGMTLYIFTKDTDGTSTCYDKCAENWPPLLVDNADAIKAGVNVVGTFGTTTRKDGTLQVTYNNMPLYYFKNDKAIGDVTGQAVGDVWFVVAPNTVNVSKTDAIGEFLTTADGMTLYVFANDSTDTSTCVDDCAKAWPPYTVAVADNINAGGLTGKLGTIKRGETFQVTYNGMPLYLYAQDKAPGDTNGHNMGNVWTAAKP